MASDSRIHLLEMEASVRTGLERMVMNPSLVVIDGIPKYSIVKD
jgi:hypothetical protein